MNDYTTIQINNRKLIYSIRGYHNQDLFLFELFEFIEINNRFQLCDKRISFKNILLTFDIQKHAISITI